MTPVEKTSLMDHVSSEVHTIFSILNVQFHNYFKDAKNFDKLAGFLQNGTFSWLATEAILQIYNTESGARVAYYNFASHNG
jgi:hypothetical protein